jgi:glycerophosphoryl diester phosphodiesterase
MRDQVVVSSFDPRALVRISAADPGLATAALYNEELQRGMTPAEILGLTGALGFNLSRSQITPGIVTACHAVGAPVAVYTVDDAREMRLMIAMGADAIITNHPDRLIEVLCEGA